MGALSIRILVREPYPYQQWLALVFCFITASWSLVWAFDQNGLCALRGVGNRPESEGYFFADTFFLVKGNGNRDQTPGERGSGSS